MKSSAILLFGGCIIAVQPFLMQRLQSQEMHQDIVWKFDETEGTLAHDSAGNVDDTIDGLWWRVPGVDGNALQFDGYTTRITRSADRTPRIQDGFTISAWVALNNYPWNWVPLADQDQDDEVGFFFGIDAFGHPGFNLSIDGIWQHLTSPMLLPLKKFCLVTATFDPGTGIALYVNGTSAGNISVRGHFVQATGADLIVGRVRKPQLPYPSWLIHPKDPVNYSLDGFLDDLEISDGARSMEAARDAFSAVKLASQDVIGYPVMPSGPPGKGPFGALYASLKFERSWDVPRRIGPNSDVVVRFDQSPMRLVFWQGTNYVPAWVTENGKWYTDEFLETWGPGCVEGGDCEPMSDKQSRYSHVSIIESSDARAVIHWRYALTETRNYKGAHVDPQTGWFDWADEYWTVYPDGVAVRKQLLWSSDVMKLPHEWQETIVINGPGQRPEDNIQPDALTLENMAGETATYHWGAKADQAFSYPKGPDKLDQPGNANIQIVHLKSAENPFQIVWPKGVSHDSYNGEKSYSMFEWWNHWPVAQIASSGRPAMAADRPSHTSLSHIYWDPYEKTQHTETKLMLCGLTTLDSAHLLPFAKAWLSPPIVRVSTGDTVGVEYDPSQRAFVIHRGKDAKMTRVTVAVSANSENPLVNPAFLVENWSGPAKITVISNGVKSAVSARMGSLHGVDGDSLVAFLPFQSNEQVQIQVDPAEK